MSRTRTPGPLRSVSRALPLAGAILGHGAGAVTGVVLLAGPAARLSTTVGLALVHVVADLGAALGAVWGAVGRPHRPTQVVGLVLVTGVTASVAVLWALGPAPMWLLLRAVVVVAVAALLAARQPAATSSRLTRA